MSIVPPDPGNALNLAKNYAYDPARFGFKKQTPLGELHRWLVPNGAQWIATASPERLVSQETYDLLRAGTPATDGPYFFVGAHKYGLFDDGFEARAVEV